MHQTPLKRVWKRRPFLQHVAAAAVQSLTNSLTCGCGLCERWRHFEHHLFRLCDVRSGSSLTHDCNLTSTFITVNVGYKVRWENIKYVSLTDQSAHVALVSTGVLSRLDYSNAVLTSCMHTNAASLQWNENAASRIVFDLLLGITWLDWVALVFQSCYRIASSTRFVSWYRDPRRSLLIMNIAEASGRWYRSVWDLIVVERTNHVEEFGYTREAIYFFRP